MFNESYWIELWKEKENFRYLKSLVLFSIIISNRKIGKIFDMMKRKIKRKAQTKMKKGNQRSHWTQKGRQQNRFAHTSPLRTDIVVEAVVFTESESTALREAKAADDDDDSALLARLVDIDVFVVVNSLSLRKLLPLLPFSWYCWYWCGCCPPPANDSSSFIYPNPPPPPFTSFVGEYLLPACSLVGVFSGDLLSSPCLLDDELYKNRNISIVYLIFFTFLLLYRSN